MSKLNETFNTLSNSGVVFPVVPDYILDNLAFELRPYQKEAISRFLHYRSNIYAPRDNASNQIEKSRHLLWQMATGSGKTLIMAGLILELYKQGYRNFLFFVNSTNVLEKTYDNFTDITSQKYQFADRIEIDGQNIKINIVDNFEGADNSSINIKFLTIQKLHIDLFNIRENSIALDDLQDKKLVMLADEAHHLNSMTSRGEAEIETSWENTVQNILKSNPDNLLLEFTATIDWNNNEIAKKYSDKIIYNYDLRAFRTDGFSKDVFTFAVDNDVENRMLQAIIISHYRKRIAFDNGLFLKPVILFRSKTINDSKADFEKFNSLISDLSDTQIKTLFSNITTAGEDANIWIKAVNYFNSDIRGLVSELKQDFQEEFNLIVNSNQIESGIQSTLNSLENHDNPVRAIFAVDMLKEGWDVLNLFDIVRLYETRDGDWKNNGQTYVPGKTTISEQQLIGRGARYFPFKYNASDKYKRKFDDNELEPLRIIEQMHYHCKNDPKYITEIKSALIESGVMAGNDLVEYTLKMKEIFKTNSFQNKYVYENELLSKKDLLTENMEIVESILEEEKVILLPDYKSKTVDDYITVNLATGQFSEEGVFNG